MADPTPKVVIMKGVGSSAWSVAKWERWTTLGARLWGLPVVDEHGLEGGQRHGRRATVCMWASM
jgi:hypothetical protein